MKYPHIWIWVVEQHTISSMIKNKKYLRFSLDSPSYFTAKSLYVFRVSQHPSSGALKTVTAASGTGHNIGTAISLQHGQIGTALEGSSCTDIMTCTGNCGYSFLVLLMMGALTPKTLQWNKSDCILLHLVGLLFNVIFWNIGSDVS